MRIEESDFILEEHLGKFDLHLLKTINAKDETKKREEMVLVGYDMSLENCIRRIVIYRIARKTAIYNLKTFLAEFKNAVQELKNLVN